MVFGTIKINNYSPLSLNKRFFFLLIQSNQNSLSFLYIHNSYICSEVRQSSQSLLIGIVVTSANEQSKSKQWPTYALSFLIQLFKLWNIFYQTTEMYSRPQHNKKRYRTEADEFNTDVNRNYNNSTLPDSKLHQNPFETLNQISVPTVAPPRLAAYKLPSHLMSIHQRFHLHKNPLKKLSDINFQSCIKKEQVVPRNNNGPLVFKKNNPLFVVNTLMDILKEDSNEKKLTSCPKKLKEQKSTQYNQFSESEGRAKPQRGPRLVEAQLNLLAQQNYVFSRRKIYSEQKSRQKINTQPAELVTFYKPKPQGTVNNEFWV